MMQQRTVEKQSYASGLPMGSAAKWLSKRNRSGGAWDFQYNSSERVDGLAWEALQVQRMQDKIQR